MAGYSDYYRRTLDSNESRAGFKLVVGGTGLGKTSGIRKLIQSIPGEECQFIYIANRIQLLKEMEEGLQDKVAEGEVVMLPRNSECVDQAVKRSDFEEVFEQCSQYAPKIDKVELSRRIRNFKQIANLIEENRGKFDTQMFENQRESIAVDVIKFFKTALRTLKKQQEDADKQSNLHRKMLFNPVIQTLFPFIKFKHNTPKPRLLLTTIQKGYLGFFDGSEDTSITRLNGYVIFFDEFDFLESDLIQLICDAPQIDDPFLFVANFYREISTHKIPDLEYLVINSSSPKLHELRDWVKDEILPRVRLLDKTIGYPSIAQFTSTEGLAVEKMSIFKTNRTISQKDLYLQRTIRSFDLFNRSDSTTHSALHLFNEVSWATAQIIAFFKELQAVDEERYDEVLEHAFPQSLLANQVRRMAYLPSKFRPQQTRMGNLLEEGFGFYEIKN